MPRILDNLPEGALDSQMRAALVTTLGMARSLDVAVGYFDLRGWKLIPDEVALLPGREEDGSRLGCWSG